MRRADNKIFTALRCMTGLAIALLALAQFAFAQSEYRFQHYDTKDGLADNFVLSVEQDSLGYMWFQYYGGLTRFDGYNFNVYKHNPDDSLRSQLDFLLGRLKVDANKNIWITKNEHPERSSLLLVKYNPKTNGFEKSTFDLPTALMNNIEFDKKDPVIWVSMGTGRGLWRLEIKTKEIKKYLNPSRDEKTNLQQNSVRGSWDMGSSILITTRKGFWSFDKTSGTFKRPDCHPKDSAFIYHSIFNHIIKETKDGLWVFGPDGQLLKLGPDLSVLQEKVFPPGFALSSPPAMDEDEVFWLSTWSEGLYRFDPSDSSFINIRHVPGDPHSLLSNSLGHVTVDRDQNIWVATSKGVSKLQRNSLKVINLPGAGVGGILNSRDKESLIISKGSAGIPLNSAELFKSQTLSGTITPLQFQKLPIPTIWTVAINQFHQGKKNLWVSTFPTGIFGYPLDKNAEVIEGIPHLHLEPDPNDPNKLGISGAGSLWEDEEENLWAGSDGLRKIVPGIRYGEKGSVVAYRHSDEDPNSISSNDVIQISPESVTSLWVVTLAGVDLFHRETKIFEHVFKDREMPTSVFKASDGTLFLGTMWGLYQGTIESGHYRFDGPLIWSRAEVKDINEDQLGRLWLHSSIGLVCYSRKDRVALEFDEEDAFLHFRNINTRQFHHTSQGLMFTVDEGLTMFDPTTLAVDKNKTNPVLTKLEVNNKPPRLGNQAGDEDDFFLSADIRVLDELQIDYQHNNFLLEFSAMEMTAPKKILYRHKLDGYDKDWIETDFRNRTASYTNLDAGQYTFKVKTSNHHGVWSDQERTLKITILPPPWRTWWAYSVYSLLVAGMLVLARRNIVQRERLKSNFRLAKVEQEKEHFALEKAKEVDRVKTSFFTNISHEFRTPLTLIKGPVENLLERFKDDPDVIQRLKLVQRNSDLLLKLINQLLDLAKLESGSLKVEKSEADLFAFIRAVASSFESFARQKNVTLSVEVPIASQPALFDKDKLETILINLINNAIKFTPANGSVNITVLMPDSKCLTVSVKDTGIGIPTDQHSKIFERFHQVSEAHKEVGTGIGLSLVKELVSLMEGTISVTSKPGKGSEFTVTLPLEILESEHQVRESATHGVPSQELTANAQEPIIGISNVEHPDSAKRSVGAGRMSNDEETSAKPQVLVVEDNADLRAFIIDSLGLEFHFLEAENGLQGLEKATNEVPDLIISDVMMPEMDGITMLGKIKKDIRTSHIPLILLTAKSTEDSMLSGLESGADDYLTKPFNKNELLLKVRNRIKAQAKIREKIKLELLSEAPKIEVQSADEQFLQKVKESILARLSDEQLSVESLGEEIGLSRTQFFRKIVALTGMSANELIRKFRLQKAAQLLQQNWGPVSQVAYEVGFSNLSYFSKVFKEEFGVLPSEYAGAQ